MENASQSCGVIEVQTPAGEEQRQSKTAQQRQEYSNRPALDDCSPKKTTYALYRGSPQLPNSGEERRRENCDPVQNHPQFGGTGRIWRGLPKCFCDPLWSSS